MGLGNRLWVQDLLRGNRNVPEFLVVMAAQSLNIPKKKLHTLNSRIVQYVQSRMYRASWSWLAGALPQSHFPSPGKADPTTEHGLQFAGEPARCFR